jgi:hypothetical protein
MYSAILAALVFLMSHAENLTVLHVLEAMRPRNGGCLEILAFQLVGGFTPGLIFRANVDPPVTAWLGETKDSEGIAPDFEIYPHPRHPEFTLALPVLMDDEWANGPLRANRNQVVDCFNPSAKPFYGGAAKPVTAPQLSRKLTSVPYSG